jgi:hypothetical protein
VLPSTIRSTLRAPWQKRTSNTWLLWRLRLVTVGVVIRAQRKTGANLFDARPRWFKPHRVVEGHTTHDAFVRGALTAALDDVSVEIVPASSNIMSALFSAVMKSDACKFPLITEGMIKASMMRNPSTPYTRKSPSLTEDNDRLNLNRICNSLERKFPL